MGAHDVDKFGLKDHWRCLAAMTLVSVSTFQYGLDFGVVSGLQAMVPFLQVFGYHDPLSPTGWNITSERQQLISSLMTLGAFVTSATAGFTAVVFGRKTSLWVGCVLSVAATIMMQVTASIGVLYAARLIIGFANGIFMTHSQLWIFECSPARYRGLGISAFCIWTSVGTLVGTIVDNFTSKNTDKSAYMIPLGVVYIAPGILALGMFLIPESPRWLLNKGEAGKAEKALRWLRPTGWNVSGELSEMKTALEMERQLQSGVGVVDLFKNAIDRRRTLLSIGAVLCQAASGSMFMLAFGTYFFAIAGLSGSNFTTSPFEDSVILIAVGVLAILVNSAVVTRFGYRRVMLIAGMLLCGVCQLIIASVWQSAPFTTSSGNTVVALSVIYMFFYNGCISTYAWVAGGEIPSQRLRSYTFGLATAVGFLGAWVTTFTAPYFINPAELNWGPKYGYIWFGSCFLTAIWLFLYFPETKDRTLEEIDEMFGARVPARNFEGYQCHGAVGSSTFGSGDEKEREAKKMGNTVECAPA
ncbi:general substrate transporter [Diplogelasinospora grovesii]|uniref:General substrate transporter n=1 Tax=Diplogelasinospora grovesii TaxID=303347 RepID=A0AAN6N4Q0_9PEZI|nr:general substrate transporter [Diplogelasinospora grovesii]